MLDLSPAVVSGLGTVHGLGCGRESLAEAFRDSTTRWTAVDRSAGYHRAGSARLAGQTAGLDLSPWLSPAARRRMSRPSKLAVAATRMALADSGRAGGRLEVGEEGASPTAVVVSNTYGPTSLIEGILQQCFQGDPLAVSPALFTESVANAPAAQIAIACKAVGSNITLVQREAGALMALAQGAAEIVRGRVDCALVVAVDEMIPLLHAILDRYRALARRGADGLETARPFDRRRSGFVAAEGAAALVLEREDAVRRRGGRVLARLRAAAGAFDPRAPRTGWSDSPGILARALAAFLAGSGLAAGDIGTIVSGASGAVAGDRLEAGILKAVWDGEPLPPVLAPKAVTGELGGGFLGGLILASEGSPFGATPGFAEEDPELGIVPHDGRPLDRPDRILATGLAAGGAASWMIVEKGDAR